MTCTNSLISGELFEELLESFLKRFLRAFREEFLSLSSLYGSIFIEENEETRKYGKNLPHDVVF